MLIDLIVGARPNFIKISSIINSIDSQSVDDNKINYRLVHTGQHFDDNMSKFFFNDLELPEPDYFLHCGGGTHAEQTAKIMVEYEKILLDSLVDLVVVVGDVNSTMACAIVAKKLQVKVAHIEAGIRSYDSKMPEEINRLITDSISDIFFTTSRNANKNLALSGMKSTQIFFVGNTMIDTLLRNRKKFRKPIFWEQEGLLPGKYFVLTLHRPSNLLDNLFLLNILDIINDSCKGFKVIFPVHPRAQQLIQKYKNGLTNFYFIEPLCYLEFNFLVERSLGVITDSGGISEETTILGVPCITLRNNTERPETIDLGTNILVGNSINKLKLNINNIIEGNWKEGKIPELWDGLAGDRIVKIIKNYLKSDSKQR